ncbi:hypothetical protein NQ318_015134 [Aromia moschata]|uniref:Uncharacterized protein n=1 Tax=Aromia moschata TaxID=1265417 RepID=A0AAV8YZQ9_9CUCU|nr:hypothetical protein NQ318_015134 [Aromia moschata]
MKSCLVYLCLFLGFLVEVDLGLGRMQSSYRTIIIYKNRKTFFLATCPSVVLKNGKVKRRQRGRFVKFICNTGYLLAGERYSTCIHNRWDPSPPNASVRPTCPNKVRPPSNGLIYPSHSGAALHFFCKSGYELKGPSDVYCDGWKWDNNAPVCIQNGTKPRLFCDFEEEDLCGWSHDLNHDFDWRRENYNTPSGSIGTGPSYDHTKGPGRDGYYMYIESSSRNENDTAKLISPIFERATSPTCLEFFYHMFGATTGTLRVYLKKESEDWSLKQSPILFSKRGNQGDRWYRSYHSLDVEDEDYQIVIEGVRGPGYVSDIAIDDVRIIENCVYEEEVTSTTTEIYSTEALLTVESCENRCGRKAFANETHQILCDCDDSCYSNSTCCPDYLDFCGLGSTTDDYYTTTDMSNDLAPAQTSSPVMSSINMTSTTTTTSSTPRIPTTPTTTSTRKTPTTTSTRKPTTSQPTTRKRIMPPIPTIQVLKPPSTPKIVKKILPTMKPTMYKPFVFPTPPRKEVESNDVAEVPKQASNDDRLEIVTPPISAVENVTKKIARKEGEDRLLSNRLGNFSESDKLSSKQKPESKHYSVLLIVISVLGIGVLTTIIVVFLLKKGRFSRRRMHSSNGDSQSDVRFLTGEEILDFSLDKEYDSL